MEHIPNRNGNDGVVYEYIILLDCMYWVFQGSTFRYIDVMVALEIFNSTHLFKLSLTLLLRYGNI